MSRLALCTVTMCLAGTAAAIANKVLFELKTDGECNQSAFTKPYLMTLAMFLGEAMCLAVYHLSNWRHSRQIREAQQLQWQHQNFPQPIDSSHIASGTPQNRLQQRLLSEHASSEAEDANDDDIYNSSFASQRVPLTSPPLASEESPEYNSPSPGSSSVSQAKRESSNGFSLSQQSMHDEEAESPAPGAVKPHVLLYCILSLFDLSATAVSGVGLEFITASMNQMLRGSAIVFVALFSLCLLKSSRIVCRQWSAIMSVVLGLVLVGCSGMLRGNSEQVTPTGSHANIPVTDDTHDAPLDKQLLGCMLVLLGTAINSMQNVIEEMLLKHPKYLPVAPLELVGWEGVWGTLLCAFVLLPAAQHLPGDDCGGLAENTLDSFSQLSHRPLLSLLILVYIFALAALNFSSMEISRLTSAVHRNLIAAARTVLVFGVEVLLWYVFTNHAFGEKVDVFTLLQLTGFAALVGGTILYSSAVKQAREEQLKQQSDDDVAALHRSLMQSEDPGIV